ncbi:MAG TPA: glycosyltransferase family 92 protein [Xanthobacteraceae bacterium]|nr:glycosyltransferase family 92 protein [Xanthobacteraceae bacterium]
MTNGIRFHAAVGVTQFYLYDNGSRDHAYEVLRPLIDRGVVTLQHWLGKASQPSAYRDCLAPRWKAARRIAFIDVGEFLFLPHHATSGPLWNGIRMFLHYSFTA